MKMQRMLPALRRGIARLASVSGSGDEGQRHVRPLRISPLSREETRLAVIEVLG